MQHVYLEEEAQRILDAFPAAKLEELLELAHRARIDRDVFKNPARIELPEGWEYALYGNCVLARYQDGEQGRRAIFVPQIWIEFKYCDSIEAKKSVLKKLPLGFCSCGKSIPIIQAALWASDLQNQKNLSGLPARVLGYSTAFVLTLWACVRREQEYALIYNRHPDCL